jgi:6-phosphogluconolactonase (cycloisomerase 2 family)
MSIISYTSSRGLLLAAALFASASSALARPDSARAQVGAVYTLSNARGGNAVLVYPRTAAGELGAPVAIGTGGTGTGGGLGNQGAVFLTQNEKWLLAVNAGSDSISAFAVDHDGIRLTDVVASGGVRPVSITEHHGVVYVLNAGSDAISGFTVDAEGRLAPLPGSTRSLGGVGMAAAQVSFSPAGDLLLVTAKATNQIMTFRVDRDGIASEALVQPASGVTPFGFAFGKRDQVFVSEAFGGAPLSSAVSSYTVGADGMLATVAGSVPTTQTAACWVVVTPSGRFAYTTNAGSASVSSFAIDFDGRITLMPANGRAGETGSGPADIAITGNGQYLYTRNSGSNTISAFEVGGDGTLRPIATNTTTPVGANGLAAR